MNKQKVKLTSDTSMNRLQKNEGEEVRKRLIDNRPDDGIPSGESTLWKLSQAVSVIGRDTEDLRRRTDIDELVGSLIMRSSL